MAANSIAYWNSAPIGTKLGCLTSCSMCFIQHPIGYPFGQLRLRGSRTDDEKRAASTKEQRTVMAEVAGSEGSNLTVPIERHLARRADGSNCRSTWR